MTHSYIEYKNSIGSNVKNLAGQFLSYTYGYTHHPAQPGNACKMPHKPRSNISQFWRFKSRQKKCLSYMQYAHLRILRLQSCETVGQDTKLPFVLNQARVLKASAIVSLATHHNWIHPTIGQQFTK